ncbi:formate dehydrogenase accessory sulfurtransferase FdhD [Roseomonas sp. HJA6]|uniref:Sulfur carrier protein FdhD n=1 Tax=Roseomonas alba TaxID=2846776 RepID=A0ABS7AGX7_9PROT|nr:formate dehydrogenase accessory sulfurtransferase FdhD [Neoroseomonas alba]MBW6401310.1 formate dehydrogenase accessory sulfurtransferase FdhD [Neoroseomonas alba]
MIGHADSIVLLPKGHAGQCCPVAEEVPVALTYNGVSHAVMMATPQDLEDLALGFSLTEGLIAGSHEMLDIEVTPACRGMVVAMTVTHERFAALLSRRRNLVGRTGCGLCGVESLDQIRLGGDAVGAGPILPGDAIRRAMAALPGRQLLRNSDHAVHAAAWASARGDILLLREDVGRHNALDKLIGAMAAEGWDAAEGFALITSRCSYEMVQKAVTAGIGVLIAMSAPTQLALDVATEAGVTLAAWARGDRWTLCTHPHRVLPA